MTHKKQYIDYLKLLNYISSHNIIVHCKTKDEAINFANRLEYLVLYGSVR